jgi:hypothetical protein
MRPVGGGWPKSNQRPLFQGIEILIQSDPHDSLACVHAALSNCKGVQSTIHRRFSSFLRHPAEVRAEPVLNPDLEVFGRGLSQQHQLRSLDRSGGRLYVCVSSDMASCACRS